MLCIFNKHDYTLSLRENIICNQLGRLSGVYKLKQASQNSDTLSIGKYTTICAYVQLLLPFFYLQKCWLYSVIPVTPTFFHHQNKLQQAHN